MSVGLFGELYAADVESVSDTYLPDDYADVINKTTREALKASHEIVQLLGKERLQEIITAMMCLKTELIGESASQFFIERVPRDVLEKMCQTAEQFINNGSPVGPHAPSECTSAD